MPYEVDYKEIAQTPILDVCTMLGITELTEGTTKLGDETLTQFHGRCPISKSTNKTAFKITPKLNRYVCFCDSCKKLEKKGGDCLELVCRVRNVDRMTAAKEIKGAGKLAATPEPKQEVSSPSQASKFDPLAYLDTLATTHDELTGLGLSPETLKAFKAGYCSKGLNRGRLAVAVVDSTGVIKAFAGVPLKGEDEVLYPKGYTVPYYIGCNMVEEGQPIHLFSSIIGAMEAYENGERSLLILQRPISTDTLKSLYCLMEGKNSTTLEICY